MNSIAKHNEGTNGGLGAGRGIFLLDCFDCIVENNLAASNTGDSTGIGIEVSNTGGAGALSTTIFSNQSQDHVSNYIVSPGSFLQVLFTRSTAMFSATPVNFDNVDIS